MARSLLGVLLLAAGCTEEEPAELGVPTSDCAGTVPFTAGMSQTTTSGATVTLVRASPAPPDVGDNSWTIEVGDAMGAREGLNVDVRPWMPLHGHGLSPSNYAGSDRGDGMYEFGTFDLIMPGTWEFTIDIDVDSESSDIAVFALCAEG